MAKQTGTIQNIYKSAAELATLNPVLLPGQIAFETETVATNETRRKVGDRAGTRYNSLPYEDEARFVALEQKLTTSYILVDAYNPGITIDTQNRIHFQNDILKGKYNYVIEATQLNARFSTVNGIHIQYNEEAGSFIILLPGFVLDPNYQLIIWINTLIGASGSSPDPGNGEASGYVLSGYVQSNYVL